MDSREMLNRKLAEIQQQKEQALANFNALAGAEQVLLQLIEEMNENAED